MSMGFVAVAGLAVSAYGASKTASAQKDASRIASADSRYAADLAYKQAKAELAFNQQQYEENKGLAQRVAASQADAMDQSTKQAGEYYDYWSNTFRPIEEGLASDAQDFNTDAYREQLASQAAADAGRAFSNTQAASNRAMASMGVNPNSGRAMAMQNQNTLGLAAQRASAMTGTRMQADQLGWAKRMDAAGLGKGLPGASSAAYQVAGAMGNGAVNNQMAPGQAAFQNMHSANQLMVGGANTMANSSMTLANQSSPWGSFAGSVGGSLMGAGTYGLMKKYG